MKSTNTHNYQSNYFVQALNVYITLRDKISKVLLIEYPYHVAGNQYLGLRVEYKVPNSTDLTDEEEKYIRNWDDTLEIYLGRDSYVDTLEARNLKENIKNSADDEIKNLINLFSKFCKNVEINPDLNKRNSDDENIDLNTLRQMIYFKKNPFF